MRREIHVVLWAVGIVLIGLGVLGLVGCGAFGGVSDTRAKTSVTLAVANHVPQGKGVGVKPKTVLPGPSLNADHYAVHGQGTSGVATGTTFDLSITATTGTATIQLVSGGYTLTTVVWNTDTPSVTVGGSVDYVTVNIGTPQTIPITCVPYQGSGTLNITTGWVPDILANPGVTCGVEDFSGNVTPIPMQITSSVTAVGTATLNQGWYVGFQQITDSGMLDAGIVETIRILANASSLWNTFLTVNALQGNITLDVAWQPGLPLNLSMTPAAGSIGLYDSGPVTLTCTGVDTDAGTSAVYAWYKNGVLTALSSSNSLTLNPADFKENTISYISMIVWQSDGKRAGDAQYAVTRSPQNMDLTVSGIVSSGTGTLQLDLSGESGTIDVNMTVSGPAPYHYSFVGLPSGSNYKLEHKTDNMSQWMFWVQGGNPSPNRSDGTLISIPHGGGWICSFN